MPEPETQEAYAYTDGASTGSRGLGRRPGVEIAVGDAAAALLEKAREGDETRTLIAVGSRGLGLAKRLRLGSVSTKVLRAAGGSVLVHPGAGRAGQ